MEGNMEIIDIQKFANTVNHAFYIFDTDSLIERIAMIRKRLNNHAKLCYAMKANPFIIGVIAPYVDHFEVCSPGEFKICEAQNIDMNKIILSGVYKSKEDVEYVVSNYGSKITYTAESKLHWQLLKEAAMKYKVSLNVLPRLSSGSQFGMSKKDILELCEDIEANLKIVGIHYFVGTQRQALNKYERDFKKLEAFVETLPLENKEDLLLEYGPGLPIDYFKEDDPIENNMENALYEALDKYSKTSNITVELGRYIASPCGSYVTKVVDTKRIQGSNYCIVNGGLHHVNYYGQSMAMKTPPYYHLEKELRLNDEKDAWNVCGSLCTTSDILLKNQELQGFKIGDHLVFERVGAYSVTEAMALFLSRDLPIITFYSKEEGFKVVRESQETYTLNMERGK